MARRLYVAVLSHFAVGLSRLERNFREKKGFEKGSLIFQMKWKGFQGFSCVSN